MIVAAQSVYDYLVSLGVSDASARGILANIRAESNFNSGVMGDSNTSGGLFQHHASRLTALKQYAATQGTDWTDWHTQVDFALKEAKQYGINLQSLDPSQATADWMLQFERPKDQSQTNINNRIANLNQFTNITGPSGGAYTQEGIPEGMNPNVDTKARYYGMTQYHIGSYYYLVGKLGAAGVYYRSLKPVTAIGYTDMNPGDWQVMAQNLSNGGTYDSFQSKGMSFQEMVNTIAGAANLYGLGAMDDPGIQHLLSDLVSGVVGLGDTATITQRRNATAWWQNQTAAQANWPNLSGAEQDAEVMNMAAQLANSYWQYTGQWIDMSRMTDVNSLKAQNPDLYQYAYQVASGAMTDVEAVETWIKPTAAQDPNSWWSEQMRQRLASGYQSENDSENYAEQILKSYASFGVPHDYNQAKAYGDQITAGTMSMADVMEGMKDQAQGLFPTKPRETATDVWAQPYVSTYQTLMEKPDPGLQNNDIMSALSGGMSIGDFRKYLKAKPEWQYTKNAKDEYASKFMQIGQMMGFE